MNATTHSKTVLEFFAGIGLMRMGLERAGWSVVFANDIEADKQTIYDQNFPEPSHFNLKDVHALESDEIPFATLATASFPCNDLSLAGRRGGLSGTHSSAFWGFLEAIKRQGANRPPVILLENVPGFLTSRKGEDLREALLALNGLGYVTDLLVIDAAWFVPQSRQRLFVVAHRSPASLCVRDEVNGFFESPVRPKAVANFIFDNPDIQWCIRPLPPILKQGKKLRDIVEDLPSSSDYWWSAERRDYLISQMSERHHALLENMRHSRTYEYGTVFRRVRAGKSMAELRNDGVAGCLRTPRGGSGRQILVRAGRGTVEARLMTPRECARLMGADDFTIRVSLNQALFGFGDAVCVPVIEWLAENYLTPLSDELLAPNFRAQNQAKGPVNYRIA